MPSFNFLPIEGDPSIPGKTVCTAVGKSAPEKPELRLVAVPFEQFQRKDVSSSISPVGSNSQIQVQSNQGKRNCYKSRDKKDRISELPDEVIVGGILSKLDLKQAGKTSVLSKRWRYLWTYLTDLAFNDYYTLFYLDQVNYSAIKVKQYVNWVNRVLSAGRTIHLNSLRIHFPLLPRYTCYVTQWFNFAITTRQVKHLYLNLGSYSSIPSSTGCFLKPISRVYRNENLRSLCLLCVNISDQFLDSILPNCPNLVHLSLTYCRGFTRLKLAPPSSVSNNKLKHLLLRHCIDAYHVDIYAPNLTCFTFAGWPTHNVNFLHVPNLTEITFGSAFSLYLLENLQGSYSEHTIKYLDSFLRLSSQLHKASVAPFKQVRYSPSALGAAFGNLKNLELVVRCNHNCVLSTSFIEACPLLETFKLKFTIFKVLDIDQNNGEKTATLKHQHKKLKTIEYVGALGSESSVKLALCLTKQVLFLETFRLQGCLLDQHGDRLPFNRKKCEYVARLSLISEAAQSLAGEIRRIKQVNVVVA